MKLNYKRTVLIGMAFLSICSFWQMYDNIIPLILKNTFHLGETVTGAIMAADNIFALFLLPLFGSLSDRIDTPFGKRMPFILTGTGCAFVFLLLLPIADRNGNLPLFITALFFVLISMGLYRSPAVALMPDLTPKPLRSKGNAVINLMGAVGGVYALVMISLLVGSGATPDYFPLFLSIGLLMLFSIAILYFTVPEKKLRAQMDTQNESDKAAPASTANLPREVKRSLFFILLSVALWYIAYNAVTTAFSRYATHVWGLENGGYANCLMVATVGAIVSYIPIGVIASRFGRKRTIMSGVVLLAACFLAGFFLTRNAHTITAVMYVAFALVGLAWAAINVNSLPMVVEMCKGSDVGKFTGYYYTASMTAQVVTPVLAGTLMKAIGYQVLFPYAAFFVTMSFVTMLFVRHGDSKAEMKRGLDAFEDMDD